MSIYKELIKVFDTGIGDKITDTKGRVETIKELDNQKLITKESGYPSPFYRKPEWDKDGKKAYAMPDTNISFGYFLI